MVHILKELFFTLYTNGITGGNMKLYVEIIDEVTKECIAPNQIEAAEQGLPLEEVEYDYRGRLFLKGYAPSKSVELMQEEVRGVRDKYLVGEDYTQLPDAPFTEAEKELHQQYRQYLRDYTEGAEWWKQNPKTFEEWRNN